MNWYDKHPRLLDAMFVFNVICIVTTVCGFGWLCSWLSGS